MRSSTRAVSLIAPLTLAMSVAAPAGAKQEVLTSFATLPPVEEVIVTGHKPSADACRAIAEAKYEQWEQQRFSRVQTETFADGTTKTREKIYTDNTLYVGYGTSWGSLQLFAAQRQVESPDAVAKNMKLHDCRKGDSVQEAGEAATVYTYAVGADDNTGSATVWISDATGLPLREEMQDDQPKPAQPVKIAAVYAYDGNVVIPKQAELAERARLWRTYDQVRQLELGNGMNAGGGSRLGGSR